VTNQSGLARKKFDIETLNAIHQKMFHHLAQFGGTIEAIFFCPHGPKQGCKCRKPRTGLFDDIADRFRVSLTNVPCVGDSLSDIEAAQAINATPILVRTGNGQTLIDEEKVPEDVVVFDDLAAVVDGLVKT
jgi:D-glycero-D-manno-heptose 1,7-bisphosphate phosphatase